MTETDNKFTVSRAETLAREFLTRRPEVVIHPFGDNDLDFVATLDPSESLEVRGFSPFGVVVWGTNKPLPSESAATRFATQRWKADDGRSKGDHQFLLPVIALLYPVKDDVGYYAWISEPRFGQEGPPKLASNDRLDCTAIRRNSLDGIVQAVAGWYARLSPVLLAS